MIPPNKNIDFLSILNRFGDPGDPNWDPFCDHLRIKSAKILCSSGFYSLSRNRQMTVTTRAIVSQVGEGLYIVRGTLYKNNKGKIFKCG